MTGSAYHDLQNFRKAKMAQIILSDCFISIDAVEYSGSTTNASIAMNSEALDVTPMGAFVRSHVGGIREWSMAFEMNADEELTGQSFFELLGQVVDVEVRPTSAAVSISNPAYRGSALITEYSPLDGAVGDAHKVSLSLVSAGPLTRSTSAV